MQPTNIVKVELILKVFLEVIPLYFSIRKLILLLRMAPKIIPKVVVLKNSNKKAFLIFFEGIFESFIAAMSLLRKDKIIFKHEIIAKSVNKNTIVFNMFIIKTVLFIFSAFSLATSSVELIMQLELKSFLKSFFS